MSGPKSSGLPTKCSSKPVSSPNEFFLKPISKDEFDFVDNNRNACKKIIIKKQASPGSDQVVDLPFWTRLCISSRQLLKEKSGNVYLSEIADQIFIEVLRKFDGSKGDEKVVSFILGAWKMNQHRDMLPSVWSIIDYQKTAQSNSALKKHVEEIFPAKLLKLVELATEEEFSIMDEQIKKEKLLFAFDVTLKLAGCLARTFSALITGETTIPAWEMPIAWRSPDCRPLELEEYLRDKWRTDLADLVAMVPKSDIGWWGHKRRELKVAKTGTLSRVQSFPWKSTTKSSVLPNYLKVEEPEILYEVLKQRHRTLEKQLKDMPMDTRPLLLFKCHELSVPPVLATKYHKAEIEGQHCINLSAWFASWCCVMDHAKLKSILQTPPGSNDHANKEHLTVLKDTLANWSCPETLIQSDEPDLAIEFLEMANVRMQFVSNFTIRQQWLAVALTTVLKFELEAAPLQFCPLPDAMVKFAVEVLSMIKMTKESILLALKAHEEDCTEDLKVFAGQLMPIVVHCLSLMERPSARDGLQDLKSKCPPSFDGTRVPSECWRLDSELEAYYNRHPWYFTFYRNCSSTVPPKTSAQEKAYQILKSWRSQEEINSKIQRPEFKGLLNQGAFNCIKALGWNKKGTFVRNVIGAMAFMGYIPDNRVGPVLKNDLKSEKFDKPLSEMIEGDYKKMDLLGKMSCHCIVLINCIIQYRAEGKLLNSSPKTLVEKLVLQSLELYELEHLHLLSMLAGQFCDFEPESPCIREGKQGFEDLLDQLRILLTGKDFSLTRVGLAKDPYNTADSLFECGTKMCTRRFRDQLINLQLDINNRANNQPSLRINAALVQYLFPCYLTLMDNSNLDVNGAQFLYHLLSYMWLGCPVNEGQNKFAANKDDIIFSRKASRHYQNRILQLVNAFVDYGFEGSAEVLAEMFSKMNWCLEPSTHKNQDLLKSCIINFNSALHHFSDVNIICIIYIEFSSRLLAEVSPQRLTPQLAQLYGVHLGTHLMTNLMESEMDFEDKKFQQALKFLTATENQAHWWRSMIYLRLTDLPPKDDRFLIGALEVFADLWTAQRAAREARGQCFDKRDRSVTYHRGIDVRHAVEHFMEWHLDVSATSLGIHCPVDELELEPIPSIMRLWHNFETFDTNDSLLKELQAFQFPPASNADFPVDFEDDTEEKKKPKIKKNRVPDKAILETLAKEKEAKERRTCRMCKKKESHVANFITCSECIKTKFPKVAHFCSRLCEKRAWESFHYEHHLLFGLDMDIPSEDEA